MIELKRLQATLVWDNLNQIKEYVAWARTDIVDGGETSPKYVTGLLVVGKIGSDRKFAEKIRILRGQDMS